MEDNYKWNDGGNGLQDYRHVRISLVMKGISKENLFMFLVF